MGFSIVEASRGYSLVGVCGLLIAMASRYGARTLGCSSQVPEHRFNSWAWALLLGMWDHPGSGIEPMSPTLAGGFLTTEPPGKPNSQDFKLSHLLRTD